MSASVKDGYICASGLAFIWATSAAADHDARMDAVPRHHGAPRNISTLHSIMGICR